MNTVSVTLKNDSNQLLYVSGDPNWDDQALLVDGQLLLGDALLEPNATLVITMNWDFAPDEYMLGMIVSQTKFAANNSWQMTIGENAQTQLLDITEAYELGHPTQTYRVSNATPWALTLIWN